MSSFASQLLSRNTLILFFLLPCSISHFYLYHFNMVFTTTYIIDYAHCSFGSWWCWISNQTFYNQQILCDNKLFNKPNIIFHPLALILSYITLVTYYLAIPNHLGNEWMDEWMDWNNTHPATTSINTVVIIITIIPTCVLIMMSLMMASKFYSKENNIDSTLKQHKLDHDLIIIITFNNKFHLKIIFHQHSHRQV